MSQWSIRLMKRSELVLKAIQRLFPNSLHPETGVYVYVPVVGGI